MREGCCRSVNAGNEEVERVQKLGYGGQAGAGGGPGQAQETDVIPKTNVHGPPMSSCPTHRGISLPCYFSLISFTRAVFAKSTTLRENL